MNFQLLDFLKKLNLSNVVANTNKTLNIIKKTIPVYREVKPYITREKSFFKKNENLPQIDHIKESKPLKDETRSSNFNDTLTFFQ